jgi:type I restriction enzyme M protein
MGVLVDRRHRELTDEELLKITSTYHAWRGEGGKYEDVPGFCRAVKLDEIRKHGHILTPGRYVGAEEVEEDGEPFEEKMARLTVELAGQFRRSRELEEEIGKNLAGLGYG